uniref:Uncharacterized protein n=1 Tax=Strongyloides venezuelensis TaxID=75913 RepID=A0A0K0EU00_STRVS
MFSNKYNNKIKGRNLNNILLNNMKILVYIEIN